MRRLLNLLAIGAALAALSFVVVGCGGDGDGGNTNAVKGSVKGAAKGTYLGTVQDTQAYIALFSNGKQLTGYVCDGTPNAVDVYFWLDNAAITHGSAKLVSRQGDSLGEASFADGQATGEVLIAGKSHSFTAKAKDGVAVYRAIKGPNRCARPT
jgi:hypothetical protein